MRNINDYINEHLEINEGLIGDIIRKLLDTGLRWIEGSVKYIADKSVDATAELWRTHKGFLIDEYDGLIRRNPRLRVDNNLPQYATNPETVANANTLYFYDDDFNEYPAKDRIKYAKRIIKKYKTRGGAQEAIDRQIGIAVAQCYTGIMNNKNASDNDKQLAKDFLNEIKSKESENVNYHIDEAIKDFSKKR